MTLKELILICLCLIAWGIVISIIIKEYPPKLPQLTTYIPAKSIDIYLETGRMYCLDNVQYIQDDKFLRVYSEENIKMLFPVEKIESVKITTEENNITKCITK